MAIRYITGWPAFYLDELTLSEMTVELTIQQEHMLLMQRVLNPWAKQE